MAIHLCRDFVTLPTASSPGTNMYVLSIFLYHVLGFNFIAHRNFPLQSSFYEKGGTTLLSGNILYASINTGSAGNYQVFIPTASYRVEANDVNRILALKSDAYPKANSGLFRIVSASLSENLVTIDYRVNTGTLPPPDDRLRWRIYEAETVVSNTWSSGSNMTGSLTGSSLRFGYNTWDAGSTGSLPAAASRIFLESPDDSKWQVRLCLESDFSVKSGSCAVGFTVAPGFYASTPPFESPNSRTLHGPLFFNTTSSLQQGMAVGPGQLLVNNVWTTGSWRIIMIGDDETGTCLIVTRGQTLLRSGWAAFGIAEDEHLFPNIPPDPNTMLRLFTMGSARAQGCLNWKTDFFNAGGTPPINVVAWGNNEQPVPAALSAYADIFNQATHFKDITVAGTTSFGGYAEVIDVDILAGTFDTIAAPTTASLFTFMPRRVGRFPFARLGSGKFPGIPSTVGYATWSHSPDDPGDPGAGPRWLHTEGGIFLPWGGPALSGSSTGALVWPISGSQYDDEGLLSYEGNTIGADPESNPAPAPLPKDIDSTRYRKTYSYYRQPVVETGVVKGGSNKPK